MWGILCNPSPLSKPIKRGSGDSGSAGSAISDGAGVSLSVTLL